MRRVGYAVYEANPFDPTQTIDLPSRIQVPIVGRLQSLWKTMRKQVINAFPVPPGLPEDPGAYLSSVDNIYQSDAYHSLSIEGYRVTPGLIDRVRSGNWNPDTIRMDTESRDALAAHGYWQSFRLVREAVSGILNGASAGVLIREEHNEWYRELFLPCVTAGLIEAAELAGYRNHAVHIRESRHVPPRKEMVGDAMRAFFDLLENETEPSVRAVLGHWLFGYIHPYPDGNGRMGRFVMNAMLASGGYPWTVIRVEGRRLYMKALERASTDQDILPFAQLVAKRLDCLIREGTIDCNHDESHG